MPALPEGFEEAHDKEKSESDDAAGFRTKDEYIKLYDEQRAATLALVDKVSDEVLDEPSPEGINKIAATKGDILLLASDHELMHTGQYSSVRRKLGKPRAF